MNESTWTSIFVARTAALRGAAADIELIRLLALDVYPIYRHVDPLQAAEQEIGRHGNPGAWDADAAANPADGEHGATPAPKLVLIADDYDDSAQLIADLVEHASHHEAVAAKDGAEAVELALRRRPDVAILDIDMPRIDGIGAARAMREAFGEQRPLLIAFTGGVRADDATFSGQFDHVLKKPVAIDRLLALIDAS